MKKLFKKSPKILAFALVFALLMGLVPFAFNVEKVEAKADDNVKTADVFMIAGQSNAAGSTRKDATVNMVPKPFNPTQNVLYYGETHRTTQGIRGRMIKDFRPVQHGCGFTDNHVGFELGLAEKLNVLPEYQGENKKAIIFKSAAGGTQVMPTGNYNNFGNWYPRSLWEIDYETENYNHMIGLQYRSFLTLFKEFLVDVKEQGYEKIVLKGFFWMQGESDRGTPEEYVDVCGAMFKDFRTDIGKILGEDCSDLPIFIGEISRTFSSAYKDSVETNLKFIEYQHKLAATLPAAYVVPIKDYDINQLVNNTNVVKGSDSAHYNYDDVCAIGRDFADKYLEINGKELRYINLVPDLSTNVAKLASAASIISFDNSLGANVEVSAKSVNFTVSLPEKYKVESITSENAKVELTGKTFKEDSLAPDYVYTVSEMPGEGDVDINIKYKSNKAYPVTVTVEDTTYGRVPSKKNIVNAYAGCKYLFKTAPEYNGAVEKIIVNGVEVPGQLDVIDYLFEDWEEKFVTEDTKKLEIEIVYGEYEAVKDKLTAKEEDKKPSTSGSSCSSRTVSLPDLFAVLAAVGVALFIIRKR